MGWNWGLGADATAIVLPFSFRGRTGLSSLPRGLGGGRKKAEAQAKKKQKKIRHPGLESGESAWKAEVLPLHQWRVRAAPMGAQRRELSEAVFYLLVRFKPKNRTVFLPPAVPRSREL